MARWMRFESIKNGTTILINMDQHAVAKERVLNVKGDLDDQGGTSMGMLVCGEHVKGNIEDLAIQLEAEHFVAR